MSDDDFYSTLPLLEDLLDIADPKKFTAVPTSWYVIVTDITESTQAIASGHYKEINFLGAASIVAILNIARDIEIPFIFGGDGASILIPASLLSTAKEALVATQKLARSNFNLNLRVGIVPVSAICNAGFAVKIAKLKISKNYSQAMLTGGGLTYATEFIKDYGIPDIFQLKRRGSSLKADFSGLECRWQDIPSKYEEVVSLHVLAIAQVKQEISEIYRDVLEKIQEIYGTRDDFNPVVSEYLNLTFSPKKLATEVRLRAESKHVLNQLVYLWKIRLENLLGVLFMRFKLVLDGVDWGSYKETIIAATDCQKFDDMLRMIFSGNTAQSNQLIDYLEKRYKNGDLIYGLHISDRVLMTCLVFERNGRQVHFIDGADGGFTLAAKALKERMLRKSLNWKTFLKMVRRRKSSDFT